MSEALRITGPNTGCDAARKRANTWLVVLASAVGVTQGVALIASLSGQYVPGWVNAFTLAMLVAGTWLVWRMPLNPGSNAMTCVATPSKSEARASHAQIEAQLSTLPEEFRVLRSFRTPEDTFEYIVAAPNGLFVIEARSWRGFVSADGTGELLHNGAEMPEPHIRTLMARIMELSRALREAEPTLEIYAQPVLVFTAAEVKAPFGTTRTVHCITDEQLATYLLQTKRGYPMENAELQALERVLAGLQVHQGLAQAC